jgi:hypothetical protein
MWQITRGTASSRQSPLHRLLWAIGRPPQSLATLTFEQAGRDFKKLLITRE